MFFSLEQINKTCSTAPGQDYLHWSFKFAKWTMPLTFIFKFIYPPPSPTQRRKRIVPMSRPCQQSTPRQICPADLRTCSSGNQTTDCILHLVRQSAPTAPQMGWVRQSAPSAKNGPGKEVCTLNHKWARWGSLHRQPQMGRVGQSAPSIPNGPGEAVCTINHKWAWWSSLHPQLQMGWVRQSAPSITNGQSGAVCTLNHKWAEWGSLQSQMGQVGQSVPSATNGPGEAVCVLSHKWAWSGSLCPQPQMGQVGQSVPSTTTLATHSPTFGFSGPDSVFWS